MKRYLYLWAVMCFLITGCAAVGSGPSRLQSSNKQPGGIITARHNQEQDEILASDTSFNVETGRITYTLPQQAWVRIRLGVKDGGPMLRTLIDWELRPQGQNEEIWNGKDDSGSSFIGNREKLLVVLNCRQNNSKQNVDDVLPKIDFRKSPHANISLPEAKDRKGDLPILSGITPLRVDISEEDKQWLANERYEIVFFIDYVFLCEAEEGTSPFTYLFNTKGINEGEHLLTINIVTYNGEVGVKTVKVFVHSNDKT